MLAFLPAKCADERQLIVAQARQTLFAHLEQVQRTVLDAISRDTIGTASNAYAETAVVLATRVDRGVLRLPWTNPNKSGVRRR